MTFEGLLREIKFQNTAKELILGTLNQKTKVGLIKRSYAEEIISSARDEVNNDSIEELEIRIGRRLDIGKRNRLWHN